MTAPRTRKQSKEYARYLKASLKKGCDCEMCAINEHSPQLVAQTKYFKVIRNLFPYSLWDDHEVADHLMLVPVAHVKSLSELPTEATAEFVEILGDHEQRGYNIYARAPQSQSRSIVHQHTHLIKNHGASRKMVLYIKRPYIRIAR